LPNSYSGQIFLTCGFNFYVR